MPVIVPSHLPHRQGADWGVPTSPMPWKTAHWLCPHSFATNARSPSPTARTLLGTWKSSTNGELDFLAKLNFINFPGRQPSVWLRRCLCHRLRSQVLLQDQLLSWTSTALSAPGQEGRRMSSLDTWGPSTSSLRVAVVLYCLYFLHRFWIISTWWIYVVIHLFWTHALVSETDFSKIATVQTMRICISFGR